MVISLDHSRAKGHNLIKVGLQILILHLPHLPYIPGGFILISTQVQGPMEDNPVEFPAKRLVKVLSVVPYPVDADIDLPCHRLAGFGHIKGDDVRIIIVLQVGLIDFQQGLVGTKDIIHCSKGLAFLAKKGSDKCFQPAAFLEGETGIRKVESDAGIDGI